MKRVFIDRANGVVMVNGRKIPRLLLRMIRGAVGKKFVVKHYKGGRVVITKFPDMSGIVASGKQRVRRDLFREAVVYAKWIVEDAERKKAFRKTLPRRKQKHVYQAAIQMYMRMEGDQKWLKKQLAVKEVVRSMKGERVNVKSESARGGYASNGSGLFEQVGLWRVLWQKKICWREVVKGVVVEDDLVVMRI